MQIRLLGHVDASVDDRPLELGGSKPRAVLAMLGLEANQLVSAERLIAGLWGEPPPPSAAKMVQNYILRLRMIVAAGPAERITRTGRHVLDGPGRHVADARGAAGVATSQLPATNVPSW